jgi:hypothetical protein
VEAKQSIKEKEFKMILKKVVLINLELLHTKIQEGQIEEVEVIQKEEIMIEGEEEEEDLQKIISKNLLKKVKSVQKTSSIFYLALAKIQNQSQMKN